MAVDRARERREAERRRLSRRHEDRSGSTNRRQEQRRYPRRTKQLRARIFRPSRKSGQELDFSASLDTRDISIGGAYFQSSFFIKEGTPVEVQVDLPEINRSLHLAAQVVHVIRDGEWGDDPKPPGFALRFTKFYGDSEISLRAYLAEGDLHNFVATFIEQNAGLPRELDVELLVEMVVRWEMYQERLASSEP